MMKKFSISIIIVIVAAATAVFYSCRVLGDLSQNMVRLHVIANSDTEKDQALKLLVRDRMLKEGEYIFGGSPSRENTLASLEDNRGKLITAAEEEIKKAGFDYAVKIETGSYFFPAKSYENISLPAGNYEAVRVVLGEGSGQNWWCVMFPPLCFVDSSMGVADEKADEILKSKLNGDEYTLITGSGELPVDIRFKIVDFIQNSANNIKMAFDK